MRRSVPSPRREAKVVHFEALKLGHFGAAVHLARIHSFDVLSFKVEHDKFVQTVDVRKFFNQVLSIASNL